MTFDAIEKSIDSGEPYEVYEFTRGTLKWNFTSFQEDIVFPVITYTAIPIERSKIEDSSELGRSPITISLSSLEGFIQQYKTYPPSEITTLVIKRGHSSLTQADMVVRWMGRLLNISWKGEIAELSCEPIFTSINRLGLRRKYTRQCSHVLYGKKCRVNTTAFKIDGEVLSILGHKVSLAEAGVSGDNYYSGGYAEWDFEGRKEKRMIMRQIGTEITLSGVPIGLTGGNTITIYPGCDHTLDTCDGKFNNKLNCGGFPWIPSKNPFNNIALW